MTLASVIIIHFKNDALTHHVLNCLDRHQKLSPAEVIVVDNGSPTPFVEIDLANIGRPRLIRNPDNFGFGAACEAGIRVISPENAKLPIVLLNNDLSFDDDLVHGLLAALHDHPQAGLIGPRVVFPDGRFQLSWGDDLTLFSEREEQLRQRQMLEGHGDLYQRRERESREARRVDWISGAGFVVTPQALLAVSGLDGGYYFYFEDCDWSRRIRDTGMEVWYDPRVTIRHQLGGSAESKESRKPDAIDFYRSRDLGHLRYYARFCSWVQFEGLRSVLALKALRKGDIPLFREVMGRCRKRAKSLPTKWKT